jgi:hypothetical protein
MRMFWLIGRLEGMLEVLQERITRLGRGQGPIIDLTKDSEPPAERRGQLSLPPGVTLAKVRSSPRRLRTLAIAVTINHQFSLRS